MELNPYDPERCEHCGQCLLSCPMLELSEAEARTEIQRLQSGDLESPVLKACISCFSCNLACPQKLNVHDLILSRWHRKRPGLGFPWQIRLCLPEQRPPNVWTRIQKHFSPQEKALLSSLDREVSGREILYLGCNQLLNPYLALSPLLEDLPAVAAQGVCCGEPSFRLGFLDAFQRSARRWMEHWQKKAPERMVVFCPACLNMLKNVYPARLGLHPPFQVVSMYQWLAERIEEGKISLSRPLKIKVVVQDSCHGKVLGKDFMDRCRKLMEMAGARIIEAGEGPGGSTCCGFIGAAARFSPFPMYRLARARFKAAQKAGADAIAAYCNGCLLMLSMAGRLYRSSPPVYHLLEMLGAAAGHEPCSLHSTRGGQIITTALGLAVTKLIRPSGNVLDL